MTSSLREGDLKVITNITKCKKPCKYKKYVTVGEKRKTSFPSKYFAMYLCATSKSTEVKREELIYPLSSLIAEFGGTLGFFLGFSFMTVWDNIKLMGCCSKTFKMCQNAYQKRN